MNTTHTRKRLFTLLIAVAGVLTVGAVPALAEVYATRSSKDVYHTQACSTGKRIAGDHRIAFKDEAEAQATGRRKCKLCTRIEEKETDDGGEADKPATKSTDKPAKTAPADAGKPAHTGKTTGDTGKPAGTTPKATVEKPAKDAAPPGPGMARIVEVVCGDTLKSSTGMTIRLLGVSCPELEQPGGMAAKRELEDRVLNHDVALTLDPAGAKPKAADAGKKTICYAKLPRGKDLTLSLIEQGLGWYDRECKCGRKDELMKAEDVARKEKAGVWKPLTGVAATQKVVVFDGGNIFHETDCVHVKKGSKVKEMNVNDAKAAGHVPCGQWLPLVEKKKAAAGKKVEADKTGASGASTGSTPGDTGKKKPTPKATPAPKPKG